jgi:transposase
MPESVRRIEVFTGAGRRRNWSPEEKAAIIAESYVEGETVGVLKRAIMRDLIVQSRIIAQI